MEAEKEAAAFYQEHRDDPNLMGEEEAGPMPGKQGLSVTMTVRFTPEEAKQIRKIAKAKQMRYSDVLRLAVKQLAIQETAAPEMRIQQTVTQYSQSFSNNTTRSALYARSSDFQIIETPEIPARS